MPGVVPQSDLPDTYKVVPSEDLPDQALAMRKQFAAQGQPSAPVKSVSEVARGRLANLQQQNAEEAAQQAVGKEAAGVSPLTEMIPEPVRAAGVGIARGTVGALLDINKKIGIITGLDQSGGIFTPLKYLYKYENSLLDKMDLANQYYGDKSTVNLVSAFAGEQLPQGAMFVYAPVRALAKAEALGGLKVADFLKGAVLGAGVQGSFTALDYAAGTEAERKEMLSQTPTSALAILGVGIAAGLASMGHGMRYRSSKETFSQRVGIPVEETPAAMAATMESGVPVALEHQPLDTTEVENRIRGTYGALKEARSQKATAVGLVNDMPEVPPAGEGRGVVSPSQLDQMQANAERLRGVADEAQGKVSQSGVQNKGSRQQRNLIDYLLAEKDAKKAEHEYEIAKRLTPADTTGGALKARSDALAALRNSEGFERAASLQHEQALADYEAMTGKPYEIPDLPEQPDEVNRPAVAVPLKPVKKILKPLISDTAELRADSQKMSQTVAERALKARADNVEKYGIWKDPVQAIEDANGRIAKAGTLPTQGPESVARPRIASVGDALGLARDNFATFSNEFHKLLSEKVRGNEAFVRAKLLSEGQYAAADQGIYNFTKGLKAALREPGTAEIFTRAMTDEGYDSIRAADEARVKQGMPRNWTDQHEDLRNSVIALAKDIHDARAGYGLSDVTRGERLSIFFTNPKRALPFLKSGEAGPFSLTRDIGALFKAEEASGGKIHLRSKNIAEIVPAMLGEVAAEVNRAQVRWAARTTEGAWLTPAERDSLPAADRNKYARIETGDYVAKDVYDPGKPYFIKPSPRGLVGETWYKIKQSNLMIDFQHIARTGQMALSHPGLWVDPGALHDMFLGRIRTSEILQEAQRIGGLRLTSIGGDWARATETALPSGKFTRALKFSHDMVFDRFVPAQKAVVAEAAILDALKKQAAGDRYFQGMSREKLIQTTVSKVEKEFGNLDWRRRGFDPNYMKFMRMAFLAPEWNMSIMSMTFDAARELGLMARGKATDAYFAKRFLGMGITSAAAAYFSNLAIQKISGGTDWKGIGSEDMFNIVLPFKNPYSGKNIRLATLGPQFEFMKMAYQMAMHRQYATGGDVTHFARMGANEVLDFISAKAHPVFRAIGGVVLKQRDKDPTTSLMPFSADSISDAVLELHGPDHMITPTTATRVMSSWLGLRQNWDVPSLVMDDYQITAADVKRDRIKANRLRKEGNSRQAADLDKDAETLKLEFYGRYRASQFWSDIQPYFNKLK